MQVPLAYASHMGGLIPAGQAMLPLHDAGLVWGATVTDLCRTMRHKLYRLDDHIHRFRDSCQLASIPLQPSDEELTRIASQLVESNVLTLTPLQDLALVMLATPGSIGYYLGQPGGIGDGESTLVMHCFPLPFQRYRILLTDGARLVTPHVPHLPAECVPRQVKHRSRLFWWVAEQEAHRSDPLASALLLDQDGHVTETAAANFLIVKDGDVLSPRRERILPGISLQVVQALCEECRIPFVEKDLKLADCSAAEEALLTCTSFCIAPVASLNEHPFPGRRTTYQRLLAAWNTEVGFDLRNQILQACDGGS